MSNQEENIIVKKIEGPSVDDEYDFVNSTIDDSVYYEEESPKSKMRVILPLFALLVGGGAFYFIQNSKNSNNSKNIVETAKVSEAKPTAEKIATEEKVATQKEKKKSSVIEEHKVEQEVPTQYIEALAMPTIMEKEEKAKGIQPKEIKELKVEKEKPKIERIEVQKEVVVREITPTKKPEVKKIIVKKKKPTLVAHYEKIKPLTIRVKKGDTLISLAKRFYGSEKEYKRIVRANRRIRSGKTALRLGEKLIIPRKDNKTKRRYIIVEKGNTLAMIAKKFYGDEKAVSRIVRANRKIKSSRSLLHVGQKVYVPR